MNYLILTLVINKLAKIFLYESFLQSHTYPNHTESLYFLERMVHYPDSESSLEKYIYSCFRIRNINLFYRFYME